jgi:hypothetical protein
MATMAKFQRLGQICGSCSNARIVHQVAGPNRHSQVHGAFLHPHPYHTLYKLHRAGAWTPLITASHSRKIGTHYLRLTPFANVVILCSSRPCTRNHLALALTDMLSMCSPLTTDTQLTLNGYPESDLEPSSKDSVRYCMGLRTVWDRWPFAQLN